MSVPSMFSIDPDIRNKMIAAAKAPSADLSMSIAAALDLQPSPDDEHGDDFIMRLAHSAGVHPKVAMMALVNLCQPYNKMLEQVEGIAEFAVSTAPSTAITEVSLTSTSAVQVGLTPNHQALWFVGSYIEISIYRGGNSETGEQVRMLIYGVKQNPILRLLTAGQVYRIPWAGPFLSTHYFTFASPQGDAGNPVVVQLAARIRAPDIEDLKLGRRLNPSLGSYVLGRADAAAKQTAAIITSFPALQNLAPNLQALGQLRAILPQIAAKLNIR